MDELATLYFVILPIVMVAALVEGLWLSRTRAEALRLEGLGLLAGRPRRPPPAGVHSLCAGRAVAGLGVGASPVHPVARQRRSVLLLFVGLEFFYYWYHRTSHTSRWFWMAHSVHHSPNQLNLAAAYRLGWFGKFTGTSLFFTPLVLLGFTPTVVLTALFLNLLYQFWIHADWIPKLGWLEYVLNTPSSHRVHHARNPEYLDANFGGVLIVFDRLFGTYVAERADVPCEYGLVSPAVSSRNPFVVNFEPWIGLAKDLRGARSLGEVWSTCSARRAGVRTARG